MRRGLDFVDLFAGCGGLASGFVSAGFRARDGVEVDPDAAATYGENVGPVRPGSIEDANKRGWPRVALVIGGPPCQGFSQLGQRDPRDPRNSLWRHFVVALDATEAEFFVMENVPSLLSSREYARFRAEVTGPERRYFVAERILQAADFGVPQLRKRAIVLGWKKRMPEFPDPTHGTPARPWLTVRDAIGDLPPRPDGTNWHVGRPSIRPESLVRYKAVPADGGNRFQMQARLDRRGLGRLVPRCWRDKPSGTTDVFGRLWWDRPALTIRTEFYKPEKGRYLHPVEHRAITVREAARLQSFPDEFRFPETQSAVSVARQIGNAVPPALAAALGRKILEQLSQRSAATQQPAA